MTRDDLLAALEAATGPSRELDAEIAAAVGWPDSPCMKQNYRRYTESIDAALTLVPEGWNYEMHGDILGKPLVFLRTTAKHPKFCKQDDPGTIQIHTATLALSLCIAALRARGGVEEKP